MRFPLVFGPNYSFITRVTQSLSVTRVLDDLSLDFHSLNMTCNSFLEYPQDDLGLAFCSLGKSHHRSTWNNHWYCESSSRRWTVYITQLAGLCLHPSFHSCITLLTRRRGRVDVPRLPNFFPEFLSRFPVTRCTLLRATSLLEVNFRFNYRQVLLHILNRCWRKWFGPLYAQKTSPKQVVNLNLCPKFCHYLISTGLYYISVLFGEFLVL